MSRSQGHSRSREIISNSRSLGCFKAVKKQKHNFHFFRSIRGSSSQYHDTYTAIHYLNSPRSLYQYSDVAPRLSGQNCKLLKLLFSLNSQKRLGCKESNTKYGSLFRKPRSHVRILIYTERGLSH